MILALSASLADDFRSRNLSMYTLPRRTPFLAALSLSNVSLGDHLMARMHHDVSWRFQLQ